MARILLTTEDLNSVAWSFAKSLHEQKQDVLVITSKNCSFDEVPPFPIMSPFSSWSLIEAARLIPRLIAWNPDIMHFFFTAENHRPRPAHWLLSAVGSGLPQKTVAASFFVDGAIKTISEKAFLRMLDLSTFGTRSQLMRMKRKKLLPAHSISEVLPPLERHVLKTEHSIRPSLQKLLETLGDFVLVPDPPPQALKVDLFRQYGFETLILGDRFKSRSSHYRTGPINATEREFVFRQARAILLAECDLSVLELRRYHELSEVAGLPLIVTGYQNEMLPGLCRHQKSGWVLDQGLSGLEKVLDDYPGLKLGNTFSAFSGNELTDNTLNELLRLYQRSFLTRWT